MQNAAIRSELVAHRRAVQVGADLFDQGNPLVELRRGEGRVGGAAEVARVFPMGNG
jgi:hypothetical protein